MPEREFIESVLSTVVSLKVAAEHLERALSYHAKSLKFDEPEGGPEWDAFLDAHPELGDDDA